MINFKRINLKILMKLIIRKKIIKNKNVGFFNKENYILILFISC